MIKTAFTAMTLATLAAASPAFAATHHRAAVRYNAEAAYARAEAAPNAYLGNPSNLVIDNGQIVGADPDPFIRSMIERDHGLQAD